MKLLRAENIEKSFKSHKAVRGVSFEIPQGKVVGLLGPNGAGKTTSFYMVVGILAPDSGSVLLDDKDITALSSNTLLPKTLRCYSLKIYKNRGFHLLHGVNRLSGR